MILNCEGATWVFQRAANQMYVPNQGKVVGSNGVGSTQSQGFSVSLSSDSTFLAIGGYSDNSGMGLFSCDFLFVCLVTVGI
jgi:hypothetical protein